MLRTVVALCLFANATRAAALPPPVTPTDAHRHVGEYVTLVGDVAAARVIDDLFVVEFAGVDPSAFRVVMVVPMMSALPAHPEHVYEGRRVQVVGTIRRFRGRHEIVIDAPDQLSVVDLAGAPAPTSTTTTTTRPVATAPRPGPTVPAATLPALVAPPTTPVTTPSAPIDQCAPAREQWRRVRDDVRRAMRTLDDCLAGERPQCRREAAALAPALSALEWREQAIAESCP